MHVQPLRWWLSPAAAQSEVEMTSCAPPIDFSIAVSACGRPLMTSLANGWRIVLFVAGKTNSHGCDAGRFGHSVHLRDLPMTHLAFHSGVQVFAMRPSNTWEDFIDAHPRDGLARF
jgi:hypothetical protein